MNTGKKTEKRFEFDSENEFSAAETGLNRNKQKPGSIRKTKNKLTFYPNKTSSCQQVSLNIYPVRSVRERIDQNPIILIR